MAIPEEYSMRRTSAELTCWTDEARAELKPKPVHEVISHMAEQRRTEALAKLADPHKAWAARLGNIEPSVNPKVTEGKADDVPGGTLARFSLEIDPGITVPVFVITPKDAKGKLPAVVMVAQAGKQAFLKERGEEIAVLLKSGVAVCLVDVRGTGETRPGNSADRGSSRTSISQVNLILGQPVLGSQLRDLRTVIRWLASRDGIDGKKLALWGDSFARVNAPDTKLAVPLDVELPAVSEPGGANLALLAALFKEGVTTVYARGGLDSGETFSGSPYLYVPHDAVIPGALQVATLVPTVSKSHVVVYEGTVDAQNRATNGKPMAGDAATQWVIDKLRGK